MATTVIQTPAPVQTRWGMLAAYLALGVAFGIVLTKAEAISWFRMQEMFRFDSFHMYGILGSAVAVAAISIRLIKRSQAKTLDGQEIAIPPKEMGSGARYIIGGTCFGLGWALTGACPGPIVVLLGNGVSAMLVVLAAALFGTWTYGVLRSKLRH